MSYESIYHSIMSLPVFDTHTHLETNWRQSTKGLYARNFSDICRYFWFERELQAAGYRPEDFAAADEEVSPDQARALHETLGRTRNTSWTRTVMQAMEDLYGIRPDSVDRILELSQRMGQKRSDREWAGQVCDRIGIRKTVIGPGGAPAGVAVEADVDLIADRLVRVPVYGVGKLVQDRDDGDVGIDDLEEQIRVQVEDFRDRGYRTVRVQWPFSRDQDLAVRREFSREELRDGENLAQYLGHHLFRLLEEHGMGVQVFFGMDHPAAGALSELKLVRTYARNDTTWVTSMHNIFELYLGVDFELFCATELNSLDMVQAARIYPNVYPGGLWWFNFRRSVYQKNMQYRVEALPASRCTFVASDARCIEWSYIKILLIKQVMARFFHEQVRNGWLDEDAAIYTARWWLHDTAEQLYVGRDTAEGARQLVGAAGDRCEASA